MLRLSAVAQARVKRVAFVIPDGDLGIVMDFSMTVGGLSWFSGLSPRRTVVMLELRRVVR
jgi:hypothetical protein